MDAALVCGAGVGGGGGCIVEGLEGVFVTRKSF